MIEKLLDAIFILAVMAMLFIAFLWPLLINDDPSDQLLRVGSLATFGLYIACVIARLLLQHLNRATLD